MKVRSPDGQAWRVSRRWAPWRQRLRDVDADPGDLDLGGDVVVAIVLFLVLLVVMPILAVVLVAGLEFLLLLLVLPFAVLGRVLFGRQWRVEVRRGWHACHEELAGSWSSSGLRIRELAREIERGSPPVHTLSR